jgi:hypothetical protein
MALQFGVVELDLEVADFADALEPGRRGSSPAMPTMNLLSTYRDHAPNAG